MAEDYNLNLRPNVLQGAAAPMTESPQTEVKPSDSKTIEISVKIFDTPPAVPKQINQHSSSAVAENHSADKTNELGVPLISEINHKENAKLEDFHKEDEIQIKHKIGGLSTEDEAIEFEMEELKEEISTKVDLLVKQNKIRPSEAIQLEKKIFKLLEEAIGLTQDGRVIRLNKENTQEVEIKSYAHLDRETGQLRGTEENLRFFNAEVGQTIQVENEAPVEIATIELLSDVEAQIIDEVIQEHFEIRLTVRENDKTEEKKEAKESTEGTKFKASERVVVEREKPEPGQVVKERSQTVETTGILSVSQKAKERLKKLEQEIRFLEKKIDKEVKAHELLVSGSNRSQMTSLIESSSMQIESLRAEKFEKENEKKALLGNEI